MEGSAEHKVQEVSKRRKVQGLLATMPDTEDAMLIFLAGDIADFYPNLPHDAIRRARDTVIDGALGSSRH